MTRKQFFKLMFHTDTLILGFVLAFLWFGISVFVDSNIDDTKLISHKGQLTRIDSIITKIKDKPFFKEVTKELQLSLNNEDKFFTVVTTENFGAITSNLYLLDSITVFTKPKLWGIFGLKKDNAIIHLEKGEQTIIQFDNYKDSISGLYIIPFMAAIMFFIMYWVRTKRRFVFNILSNP